MVPQLWTLYPPSYIFLNFFVGLPPTQASYNISTSLLSSLSIFCAAYVHSERVPARQWIEMATNNISGPFRRGGIEVLDAYRVGDLQLRTGNTFNPSRALLRCYLHDKQHPNFWALIKNFGPNQFVLVATDGNPLSPKRTATFSLQTLHSCLSLTYACWSIIVHGVPESSGARLQAH